MSGKTTATPRWRGLPEDPTIERMAPTSRSPLKRLSRPRNPRPIRITDRDIDILRIIARYRFLSSEQVIRFIGDPEQPLLVRLKLLFWNGLLDRPRHQHSQLAMFFDEGNRPIIYGLAKKGAALLAQHGDPVNPRLSWSQKNRRATNEFLAHTLEIGEVMLAFERAVASQDAMTLVDQHDLLPYFPADRRQLRDPFCARVVVPGESQGATLTLAVIPDRLFSFAYEDGTRHNFAVEVDRGTMDINARRITGKSSFRRKLIAYFHLWRLKLHTDAWGFRGFRLLTLTTSETRIAHMLEAQQAITQGKVPALFLYSTLARLGEVGPLGPAWTTATEDRVRLLE